MVGSETNKEENKESQDPTAVPHKETIIREEPTEKDALEQEEQRGTNK